MTLGYGNSGIFRIMGNAGFISSTEEPLNGLKEASEGLA